MESLSEEFAENLDDYSNFEESQNNNCDSGSPNSRNGSESCIIGTAASPAETLLKGSVLLRLVRSGYVWVSDLSSQAWCEMKMYYSFSLPLQMPVEVVEDPVMQIGSAIHLARGKLELLFYLPALICFMQQVVIFRHNLLLCQFQSSGEWISQKH